MKNIGEVLKRAKKLPKKYKGKSTKLGGGGRFQMVKDQVAKSGASNPGAVAAAIGRAKFGAKKFSKMAAAGRKRAY